MISKCQKFKTLNLALIFLIVLLGHIIHISGFSTQTGPLLKDLLNGGELALNLEDFRPSLSVSLYSEEFPATTLINGRIVVRGGTGRGIILVIQKLDLRVKYSPEDPCRDYLLVNLKKSGTKTKNCGFLDSTDYKEGTMYGNRTFISEIDEEMEIDIRTDENRGEERNPKYNVIHIIITSYARCNTSENVKNQSNKKNFTLDLPCSDLNDSSELCIRSGLFCDGFFNCPDLRFSFYQAVVLWKKAGYMSSDEFNCKQPEEKKKVFWTSLDSNKPKGSGEVTFANNNSSRSTTDSDISFKKTGGRTVNDLAQLLIIVGVFALVVTIAFVACTWLGRSEAGKLMRTYGIREGLRQSFRRSRRNFPKPSSNLERSSSRTEIATGGPAPKIVSENRRKKRAALDESLENEAIKASLEVDAKEIKELEVAAASRIYPSERGIGKEDVGLPPPPPYSSIHVPQRRSEETKRHNDKSSMV